MKEILQENTQHPLATLLSLTSSAVCSSIAHNSYLGGVAGMGSAYVDDYFIKRGITSKHYLSTTCFWSGVTLPAANKLSGIFPEYSVYIYSGAIATSLFLSKFASDPFDYSKVVAGSFTNLALVNSIFDKNEVVSIKELYRIKDTFQESKLEGIKVILDDVRQLANNPIIPATILSAIVSGIDVYIKAWYLGYARTAISGNDFVYSFVSQNMAEDMWETIPRALKIASVGVGVEAISSLMSLLKGKIQSSSGAKIKDIVYSEIIFNEEHHNVLLQLDNPYLLSNLVNNVNTTWLIGQRNLNGLISGTMNKITALNLRNEYCPRVAVDICNEEFTYNSFE